ncbi:hypothetical protein [Burkholderia sp. Tr-20390]|uniref:hypothetical protein n=1 Tax=Burkholderia sp. Tr-20390 TaxID=2703904 RepID=UPI00197FA9FD|nr:hypothetical protein [Burkholderia sp. Tr-20390]MBN3730755.1 hypothetical protein [Burkholderia sp. Tr-20390]
MRSIELVDKPVTTIDRSVACRIPWTLQGMDRDAAARRHVSACRRHRETLAVTHRNFQSKSCNSIRQNAGLNYSNRRNFLINFLLIKQNFRAGKGI